MKIQLFGGVAATADDGAPVDVGPAKCQAVLAALALSAGSAVPVWRLVDLVWGEEPPRTAERTLQSYIARLRKGLGTETITRLGDAYRLNVEPEAVDITRFERRLEQGNVDDALSEWTGTPLAGLDAPGLKAIVAGLTERLFEAIELNLAERIETDPASAIGRLTELTATHPYREGLWALLMTALYRVGRQADALSAYRTAREQLVEQLGVEPGPRLRELELQILRQDDQLSTRQSQPAAAPTGTVTLAFTAIDGASRLWSEQRSAMSRAATRHIELVQDAAAHHGGYIFSRGSDTFGLAFSSANDAATWAEELQRALEAESWPAELRFQLSIGLHTGEAEEHGGGFFGPAVNLAAQLAAAGHGGQTLVSAATGGLLADSELRDLGLYRFDDVVSEQRILQLGLGNYPALKVEDRFQGNLPHRLNRLIGRQKETDAVVNALTTFRVVTLIGPGGIGKTRLALAAAASATADRDAWFIELAEIGSADHVAHTVAETLGIRERPAEDLAESIVATLRSRHALLVLDNCEHVIEAAADLMETIVGNCEHVRVLATSRERLGLTGERIISVPPLDPASSAVELFDERAAAASPSYDRSVHRSAVEEICGRLDGIPLAIELAAARTPSLTPSDLVERLGQRLRLLDGSRRTGPERHRTLRSAIQWSYELLDEHEQRLFEQLTIFTGPFSLSAAEALATDPPVDAIAVDNMLGRLVEQSMLVVESGPFGRRFRLLEPIRDFGLEHLVAAGRRHTMAERHAAWCLDEVTNVGELLSGWEEIEGVARLAELWPNLRAAFDWACETDNRTIARALVQPIVTEIVLRSSYEIGDWIERLLGITPRDDEEGLIFCLYAAGLRYALGQNPEAYESLAASHRAPDHPLVHHGRAFAHDDYEALARWAPRAVTELRRRGQHHQAERAEIDSGAALLNLGRLDEHDELVGALNARYREQGPPTFVNWTLMLLGYSASFQGRQDRADAYFEEAISVEVPSRTHSPNQPLEARASFRRGNHIRAFRTLRSHIDEILSTDNMQVGSIDTIEFINMMTQIGRLTEAGRMLAYLETTGLLDAPAWRTLIDESAGIVASANLTFDDHSAGGTLDDRSALEYMRDVLGELITGQSGMA